MALGRSCGRQGGPPREDRSAAVRMAGRRAVIRVDWRDRSAGERVQDRRRRRTWWWLSSRSAAGWPCWGCGVVGTEVARLLTGNAGDLAARVGRPLELVGIAVRRPTRRRDAGIDPDLFTTDALEPGAPRRRRDRGDRRHRAGTHPDPRGDEARRRRRHRQQGAARRGRPDPVRGRRRARRRPLLRGRRRRARSRWCVRCASRWPATGSTGCSASSTARRTTCSTRWTPPERVSRSRCSRRRRSATPRPTRPPTSRASTPPPRRPSSPRWRSTPG